MRGPNTTPWLQLWDARTAQPLARKFAYGEARFSAASLSPDGGLLLVQTDGEIQAWDCDSGDVRHRFRAAKSGDVLGGQVVWCPDGKSFVTFDVYPESNRATFQVAQVWGIGRWQNWAGPRLPHPGIQQAGFSWDGKELLTLSRHTAKVWDLAQAQMLGLPVPCPKAVRAQLSPQGTRCVTTTERETRLWKVPDTRIDRAAAIGIWARLVSGMTVTREQASVDGGPEVWQARRLDADEASTCRQQFEELIGWKSP
jgi:WD40 repeat protein